MKRPSDSEKLQENIEKQLELGKLCLSFSLDKHDLMLLDTIKKYGRMEELEYIINHHVPFRVIKQVFQNS